MVFDCFQFFNELDILEIRLNILDAVVDKFVISESTVTFSGQKKPLYFQENAGLFYRFKDKIIHNIVGDTPDVNPFQRDSFQKCAVARGLIGCAPDDVVIFSDVDEIPNPKKVSEILSTMKQGVVYHFAQRMFYYFLNLEEQSGNLTSFTGEFDNVTHKRWLGTKMCYYSMLKKYTLEQLRFPEMKNVGVRIDDGGWHFSYVGGPQKMSVTDRILYKIKSAAHQEFNNTRVLAGIEKKVRKGVDIFNRNTSFARVEIDSSYPDYLVNNKEKYEYIILEKSNSFHFPWINKK
jgi:beta-1,4-mannosyl-glycoprotein beta-1,4-N-acetylglucosaminyltransferase